MTKQLSFMKNNKDFIDFRAKHKEFLACLYKELGGEKVDLTIEEFEIEVFTNLPADFVLDKV